jgi:hypothetical protein
MKKVLAIYLCGVLFFASGCSGAENISETSSTAKTKQNQRQEAYDYIEAGIKNGVSQEVLETLKSITVFSADGDALRVTIRVFAADGIYIPCAATELCPLIKSVAEEKEYVVGKITVHEYFESMTKENERTDFVSWETENGETGILVDDRPGKEVIKFNFSVEDLFAYFDVSET